MKTLNIDTWARREHFHLYKNFDDPFFNICADVDVTILKRYANQNDIPYFLASFYGIVKAVNAIETFRYRIHNDKVIIHEQIRGGCTVMRNDDTFGFAYFDYYEDFKTFRFQAEQEIKAVKSGEVPLDAQFGRDDVIHSSVIPWVSFRSFEHAKRLVKGDSVPKLVLGKYYMINNVIKMPVSVSVHHALADGLHVGQFFDYYQKYCNSPELHLE